MIDEYIPVALSSDESMAVDLGEVMVIGGSSVSVNANFNQTDPKKADYIVGRENIATKDDLANVVGSVCTSQIEEFGEWKTGRVTGKDSSGAIVTDTRSTMRNIKIDNISRFTSFDTTAPFRDASGYPNCWLVAVSDENGKYIEGAYVAYGKQNTAVGSWYLPDELGMHINVPALIAEHPTAYSIYLTHYYPLANEWTASNTSGLVARIENLENKIENLEEQDGADVPTETKNEPAFVLPAKTVAVVGHEWNLYFDNVVNYMPEQYLIHCKFDPAISGAKHLNGVLRFTPSENDIGIHTLTIKLYEKVEDEDNVRLVKASSVVVNVIADTALTGKKVMFIGDSLTDAGIYPAEIQHNLSNGGMLSIGTRSDTVTIGNDTLTVNHEGRSGWASYDYTRTKEGYRTNYENPFYNETAGAFDFSYYMGNQGNDGVDVVCIGLGTNGMEKKDDVCNALDIMINSIHSYDPDIKIIVSLIAPPASQDGCGNNNGMQNAGLLKGQQLAMVLAYLEKYQNTMPNVDVAELYFALDTKYDFDTVEQTASARNPQIVVRQNNNVHPSKYGYLKFADVYYNNILYHLTAE